MSGKAKFIGISLAVLFLLLSFTSFYLLSGVSDANTQVAYTLDVTDPSSGLVNVNMTVNPGPLPFVDLYLRDPVQNGKQRIQGLQVTRAGQHVAHWQALPGFPNILRVWNGFQARPVTITYQADTLWWNGKEVPGSYLDSQFGYLRGMVILYSPVSMTDLFKRSLQVSGIDAGFAELTVQLPSGWQMVSPWGSGPVQTPAARLRDGYMVLGHFSLKDLLYDNTPFLVGVSTDIDPSMQDQVTTQVQALFENMLTLTGFAPVSHTCYWSLAVLPKEIMPEPVKGTGSLIANDDIAAVAREMFHWWNGATLLTSDDAGWLREGFTLYYAAKALRQSGIWSEAEFSREMDRFVQKVSVAGQVPAMDLIKTTRQLPGSNALQPGDVASFGGALLAYSLDSQLASQGKSLDMIWPSLAAHNGPVSSEVFLAELEKIGGTGLTNACKNMLNGRTAIQVDTAAQEVTH